MIKLNDEWCFFPEDEKHWAVIRHFKCKTNGSLNQFCFLKRTFRSDMNCGICNTSCPEDIINKAKFITGNKSYGI